MVNDLTRLHPIGAVHGAYSRLEPRFSEIVDHYLQDAHKEGLSDASILRTANVGTRFLYYLQSDLCGSVSQVTEDDVAHYLLRDGHSVYSSSVRYRLSEFLEAVSVKFPEYRAFSRWIPYVRVSRKNIQYLTDDEVLEVKKICMSDGVSLSYCERAVGILLLNTGMRACDIAALPLDGIDWEKETISFVQRKTGVPLVLPMAVAVGNAIYDYIKQERHSDDAGLFVTSEGKPFSSMDVSRCVANIFKAADIRQEKGDRRGTHIFRHRLATKLLENGIPQPVISQTLGHTDPASLQAYLSADIKHLRECALSVEQYPLDWEVFKNA